MSLVGGGFGALRFVGRGLGGVGTVGRGFGGLRFVSRGLSGVGWAGDAVGFSGERSGGTAGLVLRRGTTGFDAVCLLPARQSAAVLFGDAVQRDGIATQTQRRRQGEVGGHRQAERPSADRPHAMICAIAIRSRASRGWYALTVASAAIRAEYKSRLAGRNNGAR